MSVDFAASISCEHKAAKVASLLRDTYELAPGGGVYSGFLGDGTAVSVWDVDQEDLTDDFRGSYAFRADRVKVSITRNMVVSGSIRNGDASFLSSELVTSWLIDLRWRVRGTGWFEIADRPLMAWDGNRTWFEADPDYGMAERFARSSFHTLDDFLVPAEIELDVTD